MVSKAFATLISQDYTRHSSYSRWAPFSLYRLIRDDSRSSNINFPWKHILTTTVGMYNAVTFSGHPRRCSSWTYVTASTTDNYVHGNGHAGLSILESEHCEVYDNVFVNNTFGIRIMLGGNDNDEHDNVFNRCTSFEFIADSCTICVDESSGQP